MFDINTIPVMPILIGLAIVTVLVILASGYVKASPDKAYIISGLRKNPKVLIGKAGIKIPFLEKKDELSLQLIPIDVKTSNAVPTADYININVDSTVNVKISDNEERLKLAAQNFLNKNTEYIGKVAREVLEGNVREIVGKMQLEEMVSDRQKFALLVKENAEPDLAAMGLDIVSFNVQNFVDGNGVIENLGVDNIVKIQKNAAISRAESEKEITKAQAAARKEANDAQVASDLEIAKAKAQAEKEQAIVQAQAARASQEAQIEANTVIAQKENELEIKKAELKREADNKKATADAAYSIQEENERKAIEVAKADANIAAQEKEILLRQKMAEVTEQELNANVRKKADADKYAKQQKADADLYATQKQAEADLVDSQKKADASLYATQKKAEADKFEQERSAEAKKAMAEAEKYAAVQKAEGIKAQGEADAAAIKAKGKAEAEALRAKGEAEAAAMLLKADAMQKYGDAAKMNMIVEMMPALAEAIAKPLASIDKVTVIDGGSGDSGVASYGGNAPAMLAKVIETVKETVGFDLREVMRSETYDAKVNKNINVTGVPAGEVAQAVADAVADTANHNGSGNPRL